MVPELTLHTGGHFSFPEGENHYSHGDTDPQSQLLVWLRLGSQVQGLPGLQSKSLPQKIKVEAGSALLGLSVHLTGEELRLDRRFLGGVPALKAPSVSQVLITHGKGGVSWPSTVLRSVHHSNPLPPALTICTSLSSPHYFL